MPGRERAAREADGERKTSEKANVFPKSHATVVSASGGAASCRAKADGEWEGCSTQGPRRAQGFSAGDDGAFALR